MTDYYSMCGAEDAAYEAAAEEAREQGRSMRLEGLRESVMDRHNCSCLSPLFPWNTIFVPMGEVPGIERSASLRGVCRRCKGVATRATGSHHSIWSQWRHLDSARLQMQRKWCPRCDRPCSHDHKEAVLNV